MVVTVPFIQGFGALSHQECPIVNVKKIVKGDSLRGLVNNGEEVIALEGYYTCNEISKEDVVVYTYAGNDNPIIKIVKGVPGDNFNIQRTTGGWNIMVNNEILKNSQDIPYLLTENNHQMLSLYEKDYSGVIPPNTYLILGNLPGGSIDSSHFGLVDKEGIVAKILR